LMQPIHLAIGLVEGVATAALIVFVRDARPDLFARDALPGRATSPARVPARWLAGFAALAVVMGGVMSWFASSHPDGLEWSIARVTGRSLVEQPAWPAVDAGTSVAGIVGGAATFALVLLVGLVIRRCQRLKLHVRP